MMVWILLFTLLAFPAVRVSSHDHSWGYVGPDGEKSWATKFGFCGGIQQSPIDIHEKELQYDSSLMPIKLSGYNASTTDTFTLSNNGHTVSMSLLPSMKMDIEPFQYTALQLHLHWGNTDNPKGSEHCIDGKRFAGELHVVHYNSAKYADAHAAMEVADGMAVLGIFLEVGEFNPAYDKIISQLHNIRYKGQKAQISGFNVQDLLPKRLDEYYRYEGSLTTPPCNPCVLWTVFRNPVFVSEQQMDALETALYCTDSNSNTTLELTNNYRQPQAHGGRLVLVSFRDGMVLAIVLACVLGVLLVAAMTFLAIRRSRRARQPGVNKNILYTPAAAREEENSSKV